MLVNMRPLRGDVTKGNDPGDPESQASSSVHSALSRHHFIWSSYIHCTNATDTHSHTTRLQRTVHTMSQADEMQVDTPEPVVHEQQSVESGQWPHIWIILYDPALLNSAQRSRQTLTSSILPSSNLTYDSYCEPCAQSRQFANDYRKDSKADRSSSLCKKHEVPLARRRARMASRKAMDHCYQKRKST